MNHTDNLSKVILLVGFVTTIGIHVPANAAIVTFSDKAAFLAATGATSATGPLPDLGSTATVTVGSVTFSITPPSSALFIGAGSPTPPCNDVIGCDWTTLLPGPDIAISDIENLNADLAGPVFSLGFDFVEPSDPAACYATCFDSTFTVILKNDAETVGTFLFNAPNDVAAFIGVWTDMPFNRVEIRDTTATIDDEYFGEFFTGTNPAVVPDVSGCTQLQGTPLTGRKVRLRQSFESDQTTTTDAAGCYKFDAAVSGKNFKVIINGPIVP